MNTEETKSAGANKYALFAGERCFMWAAVIGGFVGAAATRNWLALGWWASAFCFWRYSCCLEDKLSETDI